MNNGLIPARHFVQIVSANVQNEKLSDTAFREMVKAAIGEVEGGKRNVLASDPVGDVSPVRVYKLVSNSERETTPEN
jgi:hypothetical protein